MNDLIEKVKQGLKICTDPSWVGDCVIDGKHCPYAEDHIISCYTTMCNDALSVIEQMEQEIERLKNAMVETGSIHCPCSPDCGDDCEKCVDSAIAMLKEQESQRDYEASVETAEYCERYEQTYNPEDGSM